MSLGKYGEHNNCMKSFTSNTAATGYKDDEEKVQPHPRQTWLLVVIKIYFLLNAATLTKCKLDKLLLDKLQGISLISTL